MARLADPELADRRRRQILEAAQYCFRRHGFHHATMQQICAEANISAGALYRYFSSKTDIIAAIAELESRENDRAFSGAVGGSVLDRLCIVARSFFQRIADGDGALIADVFAEAARDPLLAKVLADADAQCANACAQMIATAQERGEVAPDFDPLEAAHAMFAAIEGVGLRGAMLGKTNVDAAVAQFRALAERYLMVCA